MKNLHLEHIEDVVLTFSYQGARQALNYLTLVANALQRQEAVSDSLHISTKWDGSPAIVVGRHPETQRFFVGTKSVFNKTKPKINYTIQDIYENHSGALADTLVACLNACVDLEVDGVVQGDLLFTRDRVVTHYGSSQRPLAYSFTPNTIRYQIDQSSSLIDRILAAEIGAAFHTKYVGDTLEKMIAQPLTELPHSHGNVWIADIHPTFAREVDRFEYHTINQNIELAAESVSHLSKYDLDQIVNHPNLATYIRMFFNDTVRKGQQITNPSVFVDMLIKFVHVKIEQEKSKLSTAAAIKLRDERKKELHTLIDTERETLEHLVMFQNHIIDAKHAILQTINRSVCKDVRPQIGPHTAHEGYVVYAGDAVPVKLVDRYTFSRENFLKNEATK